MNLAREDDETTTVLLSSAVPEADDNSVLGGIYMAVCLLVMSANGVVIFVIVKTLDLHLPTVWIIAHMAAWDFLMGLHYLLFSVPSAFLNRFAYSPELHVVRVATCFRAFTGGQNVLSTILMVGDRYIAIKRSLSYTSIVTKKTFCLAVLASVPINIGRMLLIVLPADRYFHDMSTAMCIAVISTTGGSLGSGILFVITFAIIVICSATIFRELLRNRRQIHSDGPSVRPPMKMGKFSLMTLLSASMYCLSFVPSLVPVLWNYLTKGNVPKSFSEFVMVSFLSNIIWNVFIYTARYEPFRDALMSLFFKTLRRRRRRAEMQATFQSYPNGARLEP